MDFVKREGNDFLAEENYKAYIETVQKSQMEVTDYQHTAISMEQLHHAMQTSLNASSIVHNLQLPISPRQMSTLMLKTNHITRSLNFNEFPAHLQRHPDIDLAQPLTNDLPQSLGRHEELGLNQNLARNLETNLARTIANELEMHNALPNTIVQNINEQDLGRNLGNDLGQSLSRIADVALPQGVVRSHGMVSEIAMSQMGRQNLEQNLIMNQDDAKRTQVQCENMMEQQSLRLDQHLGQRLEHSLVQRVDQRLDQILVQRMANVASNMPDCQSDHLMAMEFHIKAEQEDDGYFYDNMNQGLASSETVNGHIPLQQDHSQQTTPINQDHLYCVYGNQVTAVSALNPIDLYSRNQTYVQCYTSNNIARDNPQNLVIHKQFDTSSPYAGEDLKKMRQDSVAKNEEPKENLKPADQNKMYYNYNQGEFANAEKNDDDVIAQKISDDLSSGIKGEYICYKCNEMFPSKRALRQHGKACENVGDEAAEKLGKFTCAQCAYRCQSAAILKIHERTHTGEKPYSCTFCDYKSGQKNNVAKHILVHMKEKPFRCQYCEYRCAQKNNLVVHERTHTGYKPFACPYCDYRTVQKPNLVKHMYLHTDQKPFSCDMCNYRCVQKTNLTKHKQKHLNEKGEKINTKNQLKPYRPRQKSLKCPQCSYRCVQKTSLQKHLHFKHTELQTFLQTDLNPDQVMVMEDDEDNASDVQNLSVKKEQSTTKNVLEPVQIQS